MAPFEVLKEGSTLGVLGGGQLGRMFIQAAKRLGYRTAVYNDQPGSPAAEVADREWVGSFEDKDKLAQFARDVQGVTFEFENVPASAGEIISSLTRVAPSPKILEIAQNRLREKTFLKEQGFPVTEFVRAERHTPWSSFPAVLKTADSGYDGKGQFKAKSRVEFDQVVQSQKAALIVEAWVDFQIEASVVVARASNGEIKTWGVMENHHERHILDTTVAPARIPAQQSAGLIDCATRLAEKLDLVGVLCVEFFVLKDGRFLINEIAPRPHNSGHLTLDASAASQFENQARALVGLPLGNTALTQPAAMANLLGDLWEKREPYWKKIPADVKLHLYGKKEARPGRKMGHLTALAASADEALEKVRAARSAL